MPQKLIFPTRNVKEPSFIDCLYSIDKTINKMRDCYVHLEREQKIQSLKREVIDNGGDEDYDYYPEDSYYEGSEQSPAKKRRTESIGGYLKV